MPMEHIGLNGQLRHGYYCARCGEPCNMLATGHGEGKCEHRPEDVERLKELNK